MRGHPAVAKASPKKKALASSLSPAAEWVPIEKLLPWADNPRRNDHAVDPVVASIQAYGFGTPILARKANGEIIAGHTRVKAANKLGIKTVPVRYLDVSASQAHQLALADNRTGQNADWDDDALSRILQTFRDEGLGIDALHAIGFTDNEFSVLLPELTVPSLPPPETGSSLRHVQFDVDPGKELIRLRVAIADGERTRVALKKALDALKIEFAIE